MRIDTSVAATYGLESLGSVQPRKTQTPARRPGAGGDTVSISDEARQALESAHSAAAAQTSSTGGRDTSGDGQKAHDDFATFMKEARGEVGSDSDMDPVERLKKMIEKLERKMESTAKSDLPEETKQANIESLHQAIDALKKDLLSLTGPKA